LENHNIVCCPYYYNLLSIYTSNQPCKYKELVWKPQNRKDEGLKLPSYNFLIIIKKNFKHLNSLSLFCLTNYFKKVFRASWALALHPRSSHRRRSFVRLRPPPPLLSPSPPSVVLPPPQRRPPSSAYCSGDLQVKLFLRPHLAWMIPFIFALDQVRIFIFPCSDRYCFSLALKFDI
jgi:hypothetical protein